MIGQTLGHYRIESKIGEGGMGVVYRAHDERLDRDVAVKVLPVGALADEAARQRFRKEAQALSRLNHPNIATVHDFDTQGGVDFLVMELIPGVALAEKLAGGALAENEIGRFGVQLADGLAAAHDNGVIHRDLKPGNLRITPDGRLKILDFGLARLIAPLSAEGKTDTLTQTATVAGTLPYMAPEQLRGDPSDGRIDIYAAGAVFYEMATGRRPFDQTQGPMLIDAILHQAPESPRAVNPRVPPALENIIVKALDKDPARRYQTAKELRVDLERWSAPSAPVVATTHAGTRPWKWGLAAALLLLVLFGAYRLRERLQAPEEASGARITLAVLPFHMPSAAEDVRFLGIGIPDAIITRLANVARMLPRPTSAVLRYENQSVDPVQVGRELASDYVLTGLVHQAGERLQVSVQLVRVRDGAPIWGKHYDLARSDLLGLQDSISEQITQALQIQMSAAERARLYRRYTQNQAAYELYLQGRSHLAQHNSEGLRAARNEFEGALKFDGDYALARSGIALACALTRLRFASESEVQPLADRAQQEARRALALDPNLAEAHEALAAVHRAAEFDWEQTIAESDRALALNSNLDEPHYFRAAAFYHMGLMGLVEGEVKAGLEINPVNRTDPARTRGITALWSGRFRDAVPWMEEVQRLSRGSAYDWYAAQPYFYLGEQARAEAILAKLQGTSPADRRAQAILASYLAARRAKAPAKALLDVVTSGPYKDHHIAYSLGATHAQLGNRAEALRWLRQAAATGMPCYPWYERDPLLDPLRRDGEFQNFMAELKKSWEAARGRYGS